MKQQSKQILIAVVVGIACAAALFAGARWLTRPQSFSDIFPIDSEQIHQCEVLVEHVAVPRQEQSPAVLSPQQLQELLARLDQIRYKARLSALINHNPFNKAITGTRVTINPYARLFLEGKNGLRVELMLCGDTVVVNPLRGTDDRGGTYDTAGGIPYQKELVAWLEQQTSTP